MCDKINSHITHFPNKLTNLNVERDPQSQVAENYTYLSNFGPKNNKIALKHTFYSQLNRDLVC